ncbi:M20 family metallopeptidase [Geodermatophilus sp. SYSU D00814]
MPTIEELRSAVERDREDLVGYCADLVAAPSVNPPGDTRGVAGVVTSWLAGRGIGSRLEACEPTMPSVVTELDSGRPGPHLVLNVHLDTMPPGVLAEWTVPVSELTRRDGRLYGLGMGNMKGAVAAMSWALATLRDSADAWSGRVTFTAVADEVVFGDNGAAFLLRTHPAFLGDALLCGEGPGFRRVAVAEKGVLWLRVEVRAEGGHSSAVRPGRSAAAVVAECVRRLDALTGRAVVPPPGLAEVAREGDPGVLLSVNVGRVEAGTFVGQIATSASAEVDLRLPPGLGADEAEDLVRELLADLPGTTVDRMKGWDANGTAVGSPFVQHFATAVRRLRGTEPEYAVRLPASDASRWRSQGVPAICYGPQPTLSAGVDDHAEEQEVLDAAVLYAATALAFLQPGPTSAARP